jgi:hypothetical protein
LGSDSNYFWHLFDFASLVHLTVAVPAPLAGTPPFASRCAPMVSGDAPTIGAAKEMYARNM